MKNEPGTRGGWRPGAALLLTTLIAAGCDTNPTDTMPADAAFAEATVQEVWSLLPSTMELESAALDDLDATTATGDVAALLLDAGDLAAEIDAAITVGDVEATDRLEHATDTMATQGLLAALGQNRAEAVLRDVEHAFNRIDAGVGSSTDGEVRAHLAEAAAALSRARSAGARARWGVALRHALRASDALRWLDPEEKAEAAVAAADRMLARAAALAGEDPEEGIARALAAAEQLCGAAKVALETEQWRLAIANARACARISRSIIVRLGAGIAPEVLAERAEEAVAHAGVLLDRVTAEAGDVPAPRVAELLSEAGIVLERAERALEEERYRAAIFGAATSTALSLRALRLLRDDIPDPLELRATAAVEAAVALSEKVGEKIDDATPAEIVEAVGRANGLVTDARDALEASEWRRAWGLARTAVGLFVRVLLALA